MTDEEAKVRLEEYAKKYNKTIEEMKKEYEQDDMMTWDTFFEIMDRVYGNPTPSHSSKTTVRMDDLGFDDDDPFDPGVGDDIDAKIKAELGGRTPYRNDDLGFDDDNPFELGVGDDVDAKIKAELGGRATYRNDDLGFDDDSFDIGVDDDFEAKIKAELGRATPYRNKDKNRQIPREEREKPDPIMGNPYRDIDIYEFVKQNQDSISKSELMESARRTRELSTRELERMREEGIALSEREQAELQKLEETERRHSVDRGRSGRIR